MGFFKSLKNKFLNASTASAFKMIAETGNAFTAWDGNVYKSDIVRACIRPYARAIGKLTAQHVRRGTGKVEVNPEAYMKMLLRYPNPYMSGHELQYKMATQLALNGNAFALIVRDENGYPTQLYPIPAVLAEAVYPNGILHLKFTYLNGKTSVFPYTDIIHLREDFKDNDLFGDSPAGALAPLMEIVTTTDQGIVKAIRNSGVIRWLLKYSTPMRPEDLKENVQKFIDNYLSVSSSTFGAAGVDSKADAIQIKPTDYVPNPLQMANTVKRIHEFFNTNEKIVSSNYTEDEWNSYFEAVIEPLAIQMSAEFTRKLFSRRELGFGNEIYFDAASLQCASLSTKLALVAMVDRGALTPNEWRGTFNLSPIDGGDEPIRRLDTDTVNKMGNLLKCMDLENANDVKSELLELLKGVRRDGETN